MNHVQTWLEIALGCFIFRGQHNDSETTRRHRVVLHRTPHCVDGSVLAEFAALFTLGELTDGISPPRDEVVLEFSSRLGDAVIDMGGEYDPSTQWGVR